MDIQSTTRSAPTAQPKDPRLMELARKLEAGFLAEMLKSAGLGKPRETFGGGGGEDQFSSFLVQEQANAVAAAGGIGLSESIYHSLVRAETSR